jgi:enoyl-[acyl-carrier protein] reductase I
MAQRALPLMPNGGAIVSLTYWGGEAVVPGYNVMGIAKSALEHTTRYLAYELGDKGRNVRVNCISAGPFKTLAGAGVGGMDEMIAHQERKASMKRANTGEEVGDTAVYLLSALSSGVTGEVIHVDCGFSIVGL